MSDLLSAILESSRALGFLGPGDPSSHRAHAEAFVEAWATHRAAPPAAFCDLGAGGGVPGLILAARWPTARGILLEASTRRCDFLDRAVEQLGLAPRCGVARGRVEALAREPAFEHRFPLVTARSFGAPAVVAECAARLLEEGGLLIVAEPPEEQASGRRWPADGLAMLGLGPAQVGSGSRRTVVIQRIGELPARYPRRDGVPAKRPLF